MAYSGPHKLLTFGGGLFNAAEEWSCGIRFSGSALPTQAMVNATVAPLKAFFGGVPPSFMNVSSIAWSKLAPQDANGLYPDGTDAMEAVFGSPQAGASSSGVNYAPQTCMVITHTTAKPRGKGALGRVYLPYPAAALGSTGLLGTGTADGFLTAYRTLVLALNAITDMGSATVFSKLGYTNTITGFRAGLVLDTHRSRRRRLVESPRTLAL